MRNKTNKSIRKWLKLKLFGPKELADACYCFKPQYEKSKKEQSVLKLINRYKKRSHRIIKKCKDSTILKRLEKYEGEYITILDEIDGMTKNSNDYNFAIQQKIPEISKNIEGYIRAASSCKAAKKKILYYTMIRLKTNFLFCAGFYSPYVGAVDFDASVCSVESICEIEDKELEGKIADYYAIPFVSFEGKVISYGRVSVYKTN